MTEGQRVKLEEFIIDFEQVVLFAEEHRDKKYARKQRDLALKDITDHLSTIQRFGEAQTMLIKVYADELNSDSEDLLHKYRRLLEKSAR